MAVSMPPTSSSSSGHDRRTPMVASAPLRAEDSRDTVGHQGVVPLVGGTHRFGVLRADPWPYSSSPESTQRFHETDPVPPCTGDLCIGSGDFTA